MGIGDEIMASGRARTIYEKTGMRVVICDRSASPRWHEIWDGVPFLSRTREADTVPMMDGPSVRPYYRKDGQGRLVYVRAHRPTPGTIVLHEQELEIAAKFREYGPYILLEPHVKKTNSADNKEWRWERWVSLVKRLDSAGYRTAQIPFQDRRILPIVDVVPAAPDFHHVAAVIDQASVVVASEGGYHHAAAALGTKAVVLWGGLTCPDFLGYPQQTNVFHDDPETPCGRSAHCEHCRRCMDRVTVDEVFDAVMSESQC